MYHYASLPNGIRIIFRSSDSPIIHAGVCIGVGSRHESAPYEGMAHFIEHSIFKGTQHRKAYHILNRIDGVGGELNAFTNKEDTCIYASALTEYLERCLELFADVIFHSTFPQHEIEKEKEVVIEEINSYRDAPADLIFDEFDELAFAGHSLAHNILGTKKNVRHFTSNDIQSFFHANYTPDRMVISVVGKVEFPRLVRLCHKYFGAEGQVASPAMVTTSDSRPQFHTFSKSISRRTHQVHLLIGGRAYDVYDTRKSTFSLLNNLLGGPAMNSRLNVAVREKFGYCYTIESQYMPFTDTGLFYIYSGVEAGAQDQAAEQILKVLKGFRDKPLSTLQLHAAQQQYIGQMAFNSEMGQNEMQGIGKSYLLFDHVDSLEEMSHEIRQVTAAQLQEAANELFNPDSLSLLSYR